MVYELKHLEYDERLHRLDLDTLQYRRRLDDLIETYKMLTGRENIHASVFFMKARLHENMQTNFFSQRVMDDWNGLPDEVVTAGSADQFQETFG